MVKQLKNQKKKAKKSSRKKQQKSSRNEAEKEQLRKIVKDGWVSNNFFYSLANKKKLFEKPFFSKQEKSSDRRIFLL